MKYTILVVVIFMAFITASSASEEQNQIILGLPAYRSAVELYKSFMPLADHLSRELNIPVKIHSETIYENHLQNLKNGTIDIAFMGPALYVLYTERYGRVPLLAGFETNGSKTFKGYIVVRKDSPITRLSELKGKKIAFGDSQSTMGFLVPCYLMMRAGVGLKNLGSYKFLDNHENVVLGVLSGSYDAGTIREDIYNRYAGEGLRALAVSESLPDHIFVARRGLSKEMINKITDILISLKDSPEGRTILGSIKRNLTALVPVRDNEYNRLRQIIKELKEAGALLQ